MNKIISYQNRAYYLDLRRILDFVSVAKKEKNTNSEITDQYDLTENGKLELTTKVRREVSGQGDTQIDNIRYDLVKTLILYLLEDDELEFEALTFSNTLCINSLVKEGLLVEVENTNE